MGNVEQNLKDLLAQSDAIKLQVIERIKLLPENAQINKINPLCYIITRSQLDDNNTLSASWYDFIFQYKKVAETLDKCDGANDIINTLTNAIHNGFINSVGEGKHFKLHPHVRGYLAQELYD